MQLAGGDWDGGSHSVTIKPCSDLRERCFWRSCALNEYFNTMHTFARIYPLLFDISFTESWKQRFKLEFFVKEINKLLSVHCGDQEHTALYLGRRPCTCHMRLQGRSQGTTLSASDLHNARPTILNHCYNMECKIIKKRAQNKTWIEADILWVNVTPNQYNALAPAIVYVSNDVTIPFSSSTSQS